MNEFAINSNHQFIKFTFQEVYGFPEKTCFKGGYAVRALVEIKSANFQVQSVLFTSTGELYQFYLQLKKCNQDMLGKACYITYEENLRFYVEYAGFGHTIIKGIFTGQSNGENEFKFEFHSDQSFVAIAIQELESIFRDYGSMKGLKSDLV